MIRQMIRQPAPHRAGNSLVEALIGLGIMGIGLTSVFALFPYSALTLSQALQDDRVTTCAVMADGQLRAIHAHSVVERGESTTEPYHHAMDNPGTTLILGGASVPLPPLPTDLNEPSYPVFVDPMGVVAVRGAVGDNGETGIPRVNLALIAAAPDPKTRALRYCSLLDGLPFDKDGTVPADFNTRELRYNYAWMLQRPVNRDRYSVRMQVVVFNQRAHLYTPPGSEAVFTGITFTPGETFFNVPATAEIRKGSWVLDATIGVASDPVDPANPAGSPVNHPLRHGEFYRVVSVTPAANGTLTLEVHKPVARPDGLIYAPNTSAYAYAGTLVSMPGVADVFERPPLTAATAP